VALVGSAAADVSPGTEVAVVDSRPTRRSRVPRPADTFGACHAWWRRVSSRQVSRQEAVMQGVITGRDVLVHTVLIVREFGPRAYLRCIRAALSGKRCTFLGALYGR